ncbi:MAG: hypothetical protein IH944_11165 [Armatimonadetes bacterium]|nr:hypothetical protein [Armatimonadota bacterium]
MKIPREMDELMWSVAEADDPEATAEFGERYPDLRIEMTKRLKMVRGLKGSRPRSRAERFVPVQTVRHFGPTKLAVAGVTALVLFSVAFASYAVFQITRKPDSNAAPVEQTPPFEPSTGLGTPDDAVGLLDVSPGRNQSADPAGPEPVNDLFLNLVTISEPRMLLTDALRAVAVQAGVTITIAPGFQDLYIRIEYIDAPAKQVLADMGRVFGFTAMQQNARSALIIPAVDPLSASSPPFGLGSSEVIAGDIVPSEPEAAPDESGGEEAEEADGGLIIITPSKSDDDDGEHKDRPGVDAGDTGDDDRGGTTP